MMKVGLAIAVLMLAACSDAAPAASAYLERVDSPECDGRTLRHICGSVPYATTMQYGFAPTCTSAPWLPGPGQRPAFRTNGQEGCQELPLSTTGTKAARCCP